MKAKRRTLFLLAGLLTVLTGALALVSWQNRRAAAESEAQQEGTIRLSAFSGDELESIRYEYEGETVALVLQSGQWVLANDPGYHISQTAVQAMADALCGLTAKRSIEDVTDYSVYGVDAPDRVVTATAGDNTLTLRFGSENELTGDRYLQIEGDAAVYTVSEDVWESFSYGKTALFAPFSPVGATVGEISAITYTVELEDGPATVNLKAAARPAESSEETDGGAGEEETQLVWQLDGEPDAAVQQALVSEMLSQLTANVTGQITLPEEPAVYGLDRPELTVVLTDTGGTQRTVRLGSGTDGYYLSVEGDESVYPVGTGVIAAFRYRADRLLEGAAGDAPGA